MLTPEQRDVYEKNRGLSAMSILATARYLANLTPEEREKSEDRASLRLSRRDDRFEAQRKIAEKLSPRVRTITNDRSRLTGVAPAAPTGASIRGGGMACARVTGGVSNPGLSEDEPLFTPVKSFFHTPAKATGSNPKSHRSLSEHDWEELGSELPEGGAAELKGASSTTFLYRDTDGLLMFYKVHNNIKSALRTKLEKAVVVAGFEMRGEVAKAADSGTPQVWCDPDYEARNAEHALPVSSASGVVLSAWCSELSRGEAFTVLKAVGRAVNDPRNIHNVSAPANQELVPIQRWLAGGPVPNWDFSGFNNYHCFVDMLCLKVVMVSGAVLSQWLL